MTLALLAALALAAGPDFDPHSDDWNGLAYLATTGDEAKVVLTFEEQLDWKTVRPTDVLVLLAPRGGPDPRQLIRFVEDGGSAVVAVDVDTEGPLARAFGLEVVDAPVVHDAYYRDAVGFPILTPNGPHFLWYHVERVVLNHPAALTIGDTRRQRTRAEVLIPFAEPGQAFAIEVHRGRGSVLFLSDASPFINHMQRSSYGDKQFVANVLRYYCSGETCAARVTVPSTRFGGVYMPGDAAGLHGVNAVFARAVSELNDLGPRASTWLGTPGRLRILGLALLAALVLSTALLPWPRGTRRFTWQRPAPYRPTHDEIWAAALSRRRQNADFAEPILALARRFERQVAERLGLPRLDALDSESGRRAVVDRIGARAGFPAKGAALRCLETFHKVRLTAGLDPRHDVRVTHADFETLWRDTESVLESLARRSP